MQRSSVVCGCLSARRHIKNENCALERGCADVLVKLPEADPASRIWGECVPLEEVDAVPASVGGRLRPGFLDTKFEREYMPSLNEPVL